jgi:hypothetical protein
MSGHHTRGSVSFGTAPNLQGELAAARKRAIEKRLSDNRALSCEHCSADPSVSPPPLPAHHIPP